MLIFSGMQPSGTLHLGNYLGMVKPLLKLQNNSQNNIIFSIADMHSITVLQNYENLYNNTVGLAAGLIASGFDYKKHILFNQSQVSEHAELAWILGCTARVGWLNRMTQFKDKAGKNREAASAGLYFYPVLMAADILLYNVDGVPVGDDQKQHLEFARDIAVKFNNDYKNDFFKMPEPLIEERARIMSLKDGTKKMSKSDVAVNSAIFITDDEETIVKKISKAKTDSGEAPSSMDELLNRPEILNLYNIYSHITDISINEVINKFINQNFSTIKQEISHQIVNLIKPVKLMYNEIIKDKQLLNHILLENKNKAKEIASKTMLEIRKIVNFYG